MSVNEIQKLLRQDIMTSDQNPVCDIELAKRMERAEGIANAEFVDAHRQAFPESGACWIEIAGTYAMFDGIDSPCTQTFGLGLTQPLQTNDIESLEAFFYARGATVYHEICPMVDESVISLLNRRGYRPLEFSNVLYRSIVGDLDLLPWEDGSILARPLESDEHLLWAEVAAKGWSDVAPDLFEYLQKLAQINPHRANGRCCVAELNGLPIAAGFLNMGNGVALLAGASTIPRFRGQGAQRALLQHRLEFAREQGCDLAVMVAHPGSASQRNAERQGFKVAYTRIKFQLNNVA